MPITDYNNTIMYKIVCDDLNVKDCYVGHTINMTKRKCTHKHACNNMNDKAHNLKIYKIIRQNGGWDNWSMILVEKFPCKDKNEACKRERELYEELDAKMNMVRPYRTHEEHKEYDIQRKKKYRQEHKAEIKEKAKLYNQEHKAEINEKQKQYYQYNKEQIKEKLKENIKCEYCARQITKRHMARHHRTCKSIGDKLCRLSPFLF